MPVYIFSKRQREIVLQLVLHAQAAGKICYSLGISEKEIESLREYIDDPFKQARKELGNE